MKLRHGHWFSGHCLKATEVYFSLKHSLRISFISYNEIPHGTLKMIFCKID